MNKLAALVALGVGGAFFALETAFPYRAIFGLSVPSLVDANQSKARAAVSSLLFDPNSAQFDALRDVDAEGVQYVCGDVNAKDRTGTYGGPRPFIYQVKIDVAQIDDSEQIARPHAAYKPCPEHLKPLPPLVDLEMAKKVLKVIPKVEPLASGTLGSSPSAMKQINGGAAAGDLKTGLGEFQNSTVIGQLTGSNASATEPERQPALDGVSPTADLNGERAWRADQPPAAWPQFPSDDPLAKAVRKRTPAQAITLASDVEARCKSFEAGRSASRPHNAEIKEALRALLAIETGSKEFPKAWALFVSLRKIDRDMAAMQSRPRASTVPARPPA